MKNKALVMTLFVMIITANIHAQLINMNPDPNGNPWISGDALVSSPLTEWQYIEIVPNTASQSITLLSSVYNNERDFFPYIYDQGSSGSCIQVAEIFYILTYEMNRKFGRIAGTEETKTNIFYPLFTYNFLNNGYYETETMSTSGFRIVRDNGCPDWLTFDDDVLYLNEPNNKYEKYKYWMTSYEKYKAGMANTISNIIYQSSFSNANFLYNIRHWINDHANGSPAQKGGGLAELLVYTLNWTIGTIPSNSSHANEKFILALGTEKGHALTIVGYDDNILTRDINQNGQYTTTVDVTGDGIVDIRDYEKGAFKVANSWGDGVYNSGYLWMPYYLFHPSNLGFGNHVARSCDVFGETGEIASPQITVKANVEHMCRKDLSFGVGYAEDANQTIPINSTSYYSSFNNQGGCYQMRGVNTYTGPIVVGLNHSYFYNPDIVGKVFFRVKEQFDPNNNANGIIHSFSLIDHRWGEDFELPCTQTDVPIVNNGETTLSINYHLLPHETTIATDLNVNSDRVSRFTTTIPNGKTFRVATNTNIDMYNSEIHIEAGGNLILFGNNTITARRGTCKIVIDGNINVYNNVNFIAEEGAELQILLNNNDLSVTFPSTHFTRCKLISKAQNITFNAALFDHCGAVTTYRGNVNAVNSTGFDNSYLRLEHLGSSSNQFMATIDGCSFNTDELMPAIFLLRYGRYLIQNNTIDGFSNGIQLFYSGGGQSGYQKIMNNNILNSTLTGVKIYTSTGVMSGTNYIHGNNFGIQLFNTCNVLLAGNPNATGTSSTQKIADNTSYEFYATNGSFPAYFKYNAIIDNDNQGNPTDPLLYYDNANCQPNQVFDVAYNYWGTSFNASADLKLNCGTFNWMPVWYPGGNIETSVAEELYSDASSQFENGNYNQAVLLFQLLIEQYPTSSYAQAAMKELLRLESFADNNYDNLKAYYLTDNTIVNDSTLSKLGAFLANKCDVELGNWENAIAWYENQILNPISSADSIFAIIDLGDIYLLMQNQGLKSSYVGNLAQYKPESKEQYSVNRDYLLSLLPFEKNQNNADPDIAGNNPDFLNQNSPNPFSESSQINYSITRVGNVDISVRNLTGQEILSLPQGIQEKGSYSVGFVNQALPSGLYFFSLKLDGNVIATRKMCVSR